MNARRLAAREISPPRALWQVAEALAEYARHFVLLFKSRIFFMTTEDCSPSSLSPYVLPSNSIGNQLPLDNQRPLAPSNLRGGD